LPKNQSKLGKCIYTQYIYMISTEYTHAVGNVPSVDVTVLVCVSMMKHCCWAFCLWAATCGVSPQSVLSIDELLKFVDQIG